MRFIKTLAISLIFLLKLTNSFGQTDSLMSVAKTLITKNKNEQAEKIYNDLLQQNNGNNDVRFALGLLYSWTKKYDKARTIFADVLKARPSSKEVYIAAINNELWVDNYNQALTIANIANTVLPNDADILLRKAKALNNLERYADAQSVIKDILAIDPNNQEAKALLSTIKSNNQKNAIGVNYTLDYFFKQINPWHWASIQYKRKTKLGAVIGRFNYANRFGSQGYQFEVDAYPSLGKKSYAYVNAGFSNTSLFPVFRFGFDYNRKLPKAFETSIGLRYLKFSSSDVYIFTGHIGKYIGNYWVSLRPFVVPDNGKVSVSGFLAMRRYFSNAENYLGAQIGYGTSPDDYSKAITGRSDLRLNEYKGKLTFNHLFGIHWIGNTSVGYAYEEYYTSSYRNHLTFDISVYYLF